MITDAETNKLLITFYSDEHGGEVYWMSKEAAAEANVVYWDKLPAPTFYYKTEKGLLKEVTLATAHQRTRGELDVLLSKVERGEGTFNNKGEYVPYKEPSTPEQTSRLQKLINNAKEQAAK